MSNKKVDNYECMFCYETKEIDKIFTVDKDRIICTTCIENLYSLIQKTDDNIKDFDLLKPKVIKNRLDEYIIGQDTPKKLMSVAIYNHYNKLINNKTDVEIDKSNILLLGPTGSGKTLIAQTIAKIIGVPIAIVDANSLTQAGYVGDDVESILTKLVMDADGDIEKAEKGIIFIDEIDKIAKSSSGISVTRDVSGEGVQQALLKIIEGDIITFSPSGERKSSTKKMNKINTKDILFICSGSFAGIEDIIKERVDIGNKSVGFINLEDNSDITTEELKFNILKQVSYEDLIIFGLIPEFIGRLHVLGVLEELNKESMLSIITKPKNAILKQYKSLFEIDDINFDVSKDGLDLIADISLNRKTGARSLRSIFEKITLDIFFEIDDYNGETILVSRKDIEKHFTKEIENMILK